MPTSNLTTVLTTLVCNTANFYVQAHAAHWNVEAPNFAELHAFFGDLYADIHGSLDPLAEFLRTHATEAPCSLADLAKGSTLAKLDAPETATGGYRGDDLLDHLGSVNRTYMQSLKAVYEAAKGAGDIGLENFCQDRMAKHRVWMWQMRSFGAE